jgi:hypothetical protein
VALSEDKLDLKVLRELCFSGKQELCFHHKNYVFFHILLTHFHVSYLSPGIPFEGGIRALCWKVSLLDRVHSESIQTP